MAEKSDLYSLLHSYSQMFDKPSFSVDEFVQFLQKQFSVDSAISDSLAEWKDNTRKKVIDKIPPLIKNGQIEFNDTLGIETVTVPVFYFEKIKTYYQNVGVDSGLEQAMPIEGAFTFRIPDERVLVLNISSNRLDYMEKTMEKDIANKEDKILKLIFPDVYGYGYTLSSMLATDLLSWAITKLKLAFRTDRAYDTFEGKLESSFSGRAGFVKECMNNFITNVGKTMAAMQECDVNTYEFWNVTCQMVKQYISDEVMRLPSVPAVYVTTYQAASIIGICNNYYKIQSVDKKQHLEMLDTIIEQMQQLPYMWTMYDILNFKYGGTPIGKVLEHDEIASYIKERLASAGEKTFPLIYSFHIKAGQKDVYVHRSSILKLCYGLISQARAAVREEVVARWQDLYLSFSGEDAMRENQAFEKLLSSLVEKDAPMLGLLLNSKWTALIEEDAGKNSLNKNKFPNLFVNYNPIPYSDMFVLRREDLLSQVKNSIPFWYSIPFFAWLGRIFFGTKKRDKRKKQPVKNSVVKHPAHVTAAPPKHHVEAAESAPHSLLDDLTGGRPVGTVLDTLADRWNTRLLADDRDKARQDVDTLIRDKTRYLLRLHGIPTMTQLDEAADTMIGTTGSLGAIPDKKHLKEYIKLSMADNIIKEKTSS